jgi:hypothetical protein
MTWLPLRAPALEVTWDFGEFFYFQRTRRFHDMPNILRVLSISVAPLRYDQPALLPNMWRKNARRLSRYGRAALLTGVTAFTASMPTTALATTFVHITDVSLLAFQTAPNGIVYLRNLNQFSSSALGCCYSYYVDSTTAEGKDIFALILSAAAQHSALWIGIPDPPAGGAVGFAGNW